MPTLICRQFHKEALGVRVKILSLFIIFLLTNTCFANSTPKKQLEKNHCAYGSHKELYQFFTEKDYVVIAQGKRIQANGKTKDFADVLFLVSPDSAYFHAVTLSGIKYDHFKACIYTSAREIDFQFASPIPNLLERRNREHLVFLINDIPKDALCPTQDSSCMPWSQWSILLKQTFILSAYSYPNNEASDPYDEIVELTLDGKTITPTRGVLTEHARVKYALRLRNALKESSSDLNAAKQAYIQIHTEVDHKLPLVFLSVDKNRHWEIIQINRENGLANIILQGIALQLYPMKQSEYEELLQEE